MTTPQRPAPNNPAARLYELLKAMREKSEKRTARQAWCIALGISENVDDAEFFQHFAEIVRLTSVVVDRLREVDAASREEVERHMGRIRSGLIGVPLSHPANQLRNQFTDLAMQALSVAGKELARWSAENPAPDDSLRSIQQQVQDLEEAVIAAMLDPDLTQLILRLLNKVRLAIIQYRVQGVVVLEDALAAVVGTMVIHLPSSSSAEQTTGRWQTIKKALAALVAALVAVTTLARNVQSLAPGVTPHSIEERLRTVHLLGSGTISE